MSNKRLGILLILIGVAVFFGSLLGLVNTLLWPQGSLPYTIGSILMLDSLGAIFVGVGIYIRASLKQRAERRLKQKYEAPQQKAEIPLEPSITRKCSDCGADLSAFPADIKLCPYCSVGLGKETNRLAPSLLIVRRLLGLSTLVILAPRIVLVVASIFLFPLAAFFYLLPIWFFLLVALYHLLGKRHRLIFECTLLVISVLSFLGMAQFLFIQTGFALLFKRYLPIMDLDDFFFVSPFIMQGLTLSSTLFSASASLLRKTKGFKWMRERNLKLFLALLTFAPFILMFLAPVQVNPGPLTGSSISGPGGGKLKLATGYGPPPAHLEYNSTEKLWIYHVHLTYPDTSYSQPPGPPGQVTEVAINKIFLGSEILMPPFNSNIVRVNGTGMEITQDGVVFTQGADGYIILKSSQAYAKVVCFDSEGVRYTFVW